MGEEVVRLEDDPDPAADRVDVDVPRRDLRSADEDPARLDRLEEVDAAQKRRLARAGRPDQADDLVLVDLEVDPAQHLELAEGLVHAFDAECEGGSSAVACRDGAHASLPACCRFRSRAISQSVNRASGIVISTNSVAATRYGVPLNVADWSICACLNASTTPSVPTRAVSFCRPMKSFRSGGITRRTACGRTTKRSDWPCERPSERAAASWLGMHRVDPRAVDLRDVGRVDEHERDDGPEELRLRQPREPERRHPEAEDGDDEDRRDAAKEVGVRDRERPDREEHRPRQRAEHGEEERRRQDQRLGDAEQLHVQPEGVQDLREAVLVDAPVEEVRLERAPAGRARDDDDDDR